MFLGALVAVLDGSSRVAATEAHKVVSCLLDTSTIPAEQVQAHELMLWRMQGLHRYANLLCPLPIDQGTALEPDSQTGIPAKLLLQCFFKQNSHHLAFFAYYIHLCFQARMFDGLQLAPQPTL